jgi:hypothetical protein
LKRSLFLASAGAAAIQGCGSRHTAGAVPSVATSSQGERVDEAHTHRVLANPIIGETMVWNGGAVPPMWMACNGALLAIADYPMLFRILRNRKPGGGDGKKTFSLPDCPHRPQIIAVSGTYPSSRAVIAALSKVRKG